MLIYRVDVVKWYGRGVRLVAWTVNSNAEKQHFDSMLQIPYLTDSVDRTREVGEQTV